MPACGRPENERGAVALSPVPAELDLLAYWIHERERVRRARESGAPRPWTADRLLDEWRWCNVRRMDDRVSRELFERWYMRQGHGMVDLRQALLARLINWPATLDELAQITPSLRGAREIVKARAEARDTNGKPKNKVFTGAYVIPGEPGRNKVDTVFDLIERVMAASQVLQPSMRATWLELMKFDGLGSFLAGQVVADLAHLAPGGDWPDADSWAPIGPGSARGLNRLRGIPKDKPVTQADFERLLPALIAELRPRIDDIWIDRRLQAMDIQNCLCEFDKYRRLTLGEGKVRARYVPAGGAEKAKDLFA